VIDRSFEDIRTYFDAVVFDLDGTLVDTAPGILAYLNEMLFEFGRPGLDLAAMRPMIGDGVRSLMTKGLEASGGVPEGLDLEALFHRYLQRYVTNPARSSLPYPGVISVLETLAESGMALGVCTNKPQEPTDRLLKSLDLEKFFGAVIGGDALPVKKPDPVHLLTVLERLEITPNRAKPTPGQPVPPTFLASW